MDLLLPENLADILCCKELGTTHHLQVKPLNLLERTQVKAVRTPEYLQSGKQY